jgi:hypothetical protein
MRHAAALCLCVLALTTFAFGGATVTVINANAAGVGFNDPTPAAPVGGNSGTTVGQQRLVAFQFAANIWGANLDSTVEIRVSAQFTALSCSASAGVLGSAGAAGSISNFPNAEFTGTWYPIALANKRAGTELGVANSAHINANFNSNVGTPGCLENSAWYYGLDANEPTGQINLVAVVHHELGHGLGFSLGPTSSSTGQRAQGQPSIYERNLLDVGTGKNWLDMTDAERASSAVNTGNLVWTGAQVLAAAPTVLSGSPQLQLTAPGAIAGTYNVGTAVFGAPLTGSPVTGRLLMAADTADSGSTTDGCSALTNAASVSGKIAVVDRGQCTFKLKTKNVLDAGGIGVVIVNNVAGAAIGMADDATITTSITIPAVSVSQTDGTSIKNQLAIPVTVNGFMALNLNQLAGADGQGRPRLYAPNPLEPGSSVSHWDTSASPNQLMEPNISSDLTHSVKAPQDLTLAQLYDIGWAPTAVPAAALSGNTIAFGTRWQGFGPNSRALALSNPGNALLTISNIAVSGSAAFTRTHDCPASLAAAGNCTITVTFNPAMLGLQNGTLTVTSNAPGSPHTVALSGTGAADLVLTLTRPQRPARNSVSGAGLQEFVLSIDPQGMQGTLQLACESPLSEVRCAVRPATLESDGRAVNAAIEVFTRRSQRLRSRSPQTRTVIVKVKATLQGVTRTIDLPVQVER